jgi:hypothetical protein
MKTEGIRIIIPRGERLPTARVGSLVPGPSLAVQHPAAVPNISAGDQYTWTLALNPDLPMSLEAELGAGNAEVYLGDLNLTDLRVEMGAGNALIDLTGDRQHLHQRRLWQDACYALRHHPVGSRHDTHRRG